MMRRLATGVAVLATVIAGASLSSAGAGGSIPPALAQANAPNIPPPPVIRRRSVTPEPLANRPERTRPRGTAQAASGTDAVEPDIVIVRLPASADTGLGARIADAYDLQVLAESRLALLDRRILRLRIPDGRPVPEVIQALTRDGRIEAAQSSFVYRLQGASGRASQYAAEALHLPAAHTMARGDSVTVALIDTGVDATHAALRGARIRSLTVLEADRSGPADHGTEMAAIIVASGPLTGVAPAAQLVVIEAFAPSSRGGPAQSQSLAVAQALDRAAQERAQVVNLSFAGGADPLVSDMLDALARRGIVLVGAAGNYGPDAPPAYPAAHPAVIAVTAIDAGDRLFASANRGRYVRLAAPGVDILSAAADGRYGIVSGTSAAAAHVTGAAALIRQLAPALSYTKVRAVLENTAVDMGQPGPDPDFGAGRIDLVEALSATAQLPARPAE